MKDEYLWDKTGEDAEIAALENALSAFRYQETAPPALPAKVITLEPQGWRRFFQLRFAVAAFASVVAVFFVFWFTLKSTKTPSFENVAEVRIPQTANKIQDEFIDPEPEIAPAKIIQKTKSNIVKTRQTTTPKIHPVKTVLRHTKISEPVETLTAEEKYAYNQLMLALSITGSQLKIVKDKIDGISEQNAVNDSTK